MSLQDQIAAMIQSEKKKACREFFDLLVEVSKFVAHFDVGYMDIALCDLIEIMTDNNTPPEAKDKTEKILDRLYDLGFRINRCHIFEQGGMVEDIVHYGTLETFSKVLKYTDCKSYNDANYRNPLMIGCHKAEKFVNEYKMDPVKVEEVLRQLYYFSVYHGFFCDGQMDVTGLTYKSADMTGLYNPDKWDKELKEEEDKWNKEMGDDDKNKNKSEKCLLCCQIFNSKPTTVRFEFERNCQSCGQLLPGCSECNS